MIKVPFLSNKVSVLFLSRNVFASLIRENRYPGTGILEPHLVSNVYIDGRQSSEEPSVWIVRGLGFRRVLADGGATYRHLYYFGIL